MGETFYTALGVDRDADTETIQRAYRERVKDHHPDVSDDDDATERFKQLTEARDVLVDASSRSRYDRVGHAAYVRRHLDGSAWNVDAGPNTTDARDRSGRSGASGQSGGSGQSGRSGGDGTRSSGTGSGRSGASARSGRRATGHGQWSTDTGGPSTGRSRGRRRGRGRSSTGTSREANTNAWTDDGRSGFTSGESNRKDSKRRRARADGWRTAHTADGYSPSGHDPGTGTVSRPASTVARFQKALRRLGPWLAFHFAFLVSAFVTVWLLVSWTPSVTSVFLGLLLLGVTVFFSILHMVSRVYA